MLSISGRFSLFPRYILRSHSVLRLYPACLLLAFSAGYRLDLFGFLWREKASVVALFHVFLVTKNLNEYFEDRFDDSEDEPKIGS